MSSATTDYCPVKVELCGGEPPRRRDGASRRRSAWPSGLSIPTTCRSIADDRASDAGPVDRRDRALRRWSARSPELRLAAVERYAVATEEADESAVADREARRWLTASARERSTDSETSQPMQASVT